MSRFTAPLVVTPSEDYRAWRVLHSASNDANPVEVEVYKDGLGPMHIKVHRFGYDIGEEGSGLTIEVPTGFETDFASIPWFARWLIPTWGRHTNAAIIHDYLYRGGRIVPGPVPLNQGGIKGIRTQFNLELPLPTRKQADRIMLEGMEVMGVRKWRRLVIYAGLRIGGWWAWRKSRR